MHFQRSYLDLVPLTKRRVSFPVRNQSAFWKLVSIPTARVQSWKRCGSALEEERIYISVLELNSILRVSDGNALFTHVGNLGVSL